MTTTDTTRVLDELILVRLLAAGEKPRPAELRKQLSGLLGEPLSAEQWHARLTDLGSAGLLTLKPLRLTEAGRARALEFLGLEVLPPRTNWKTLRDRYLVPMALGIPVGSREARDQVAKADGLAVFVLKQRFGLPPEAGKTVTQVVNALACKQLGHPEETDPNRLARLLLSRLIKSDVPLPRKTLLQQLPREAAGAPRGGADEMRKAVLRRWLSGRDDGAAVAAPQPTPVEAAPPEPAPFDLAEFAATVKAVARDCPTGWFGNNKVFINHVWRHYRAQAGVPPLDLAAFKARLVQANQARLLDLSRADLPELMDPADVRESETHQLNAVFHFVLADRRAP